MSSNLSIFASLMAIQQVQRMQKEEEVLNKNNFDDKYEYKILRSSFGFKNLEKTLKEEAENGWELLEIFDTSRVRLKRHLAMRDQPSKNGIDPYRVWVNPISTSKGLLIIFLIFSAVFFGVFLITQIIPKRY